MRAVCVLLECFLVKGIYFAVHVAESLEHKYGYNGEDLGSVYLIRHLQ